VIDLDSLVGVAKKAVALHEPETCIFTAIVPGQDLFPAVNAHLVLVFPEEIAAHGLL